MRLPPISRRRFVSSVAGAGLALPFFELLAPGRARAADGVAERFIVFYFPDGVVGPSQDGQPSQWHCTGSGSNYQLGAMLEPLGALADECLFFNGLSMGPTDSGNHPGGARKLLTGADYGNGESIDQLLARTAGADAPFRHLYLGAMANHNNPSSDKFISYVSPGNSVSPQDDPVAAFDLLFGDFVPGGGQPTGPDPQQVTVIDSVLDDMDRLRTQLGSVDQAKLDLHLESLREVEDRIKNVADLPTCEDPGLDASGLPGAGNQYDPSAFPAVLRAQIDLMVLAMSCGLSRVGVIQNSHHTSDLLMSAFPGTPMYDPGFDMRSHQASHYGPSHAPGNGLYDAFVQHNQYWVSQFAYLLQSLADRPDPLGGGSMLDTSVVLLCTEVCDGNTHQHDDMPLVLAGRGAGAIDPGRLLNFGGDRHAGLLAAIAHAMGEPIGGFGDTGSGPLSGVLG
ncbi:MAG: DUF1552 domain-containing protein [Nannocystaceae bacterium]